MLDIAEHAGLSSGTVYRYFKDKGDLFCRLLQDLTDRLNEEARMPADDEGRLVVDQSVLLYLGIYREYSSIYRAWWELLTQETEFTSAWRGWHEKSLGEMIAVVKGGQKRGFIDKAIDPEIVADLIVAAFERPVYTKIVLGWNDVSDEEIASLMGRLLGSGLALPSESADPDLSSGADQSRRPGSRVGSAVKPSSQLM